MTKRKTTVSTKPAKAKGRLPPKVKVLSSRRAFHGKVFDVYSDEVVEPGGKPHVKDVVRHHGSAVILPVQSLAPSGKRMAEPQVLLERQYRHAARKYLWEIPAGRLEKGESPLRAARRELAEETGYRAKKWSRLVRYFASPGFLGEHMEIFLAEDLTPGADSPDPDEIILHRFFPLSKVLAMIERNHIEDAKTMLAVLLYVRRRPARKLSKAKA